MKSAVFSFVDAAPSRVGAIGGTVFTGIVTLYPDVARTWTDWLMSPEQIRLFGAVGLAAFSAYWFIWLSLRSRIGEESSQSIRQAVHGPGSQVIGHANTVNINAQTPIGPMRVAAAPETIKLLRNIEEKYCRSNYAYLFKLLDLDDTVHHNIVIAVGSNLGFPYVEKENYEQSQEFFTGGGTVIQTNIENFTNGPVFNYHLPKNEVVYVNFTRSAGDVKDELAKLPLSPFLPKNVSESLSGLAKAVSELYTEMIWVLNDCFQNQRVRLIMAANDPLIAAGICNQYLDRVTKIEKQVTDLRNCIREEIDRG